MERTSWSPQRLLVFAAAAALVLGPGFENPGAAASDAPPSASPPQADPPGPSTPLTEPGNAAFAAVAEVVRELNARPDTDWSTVDLEALRRHLRDMERFTLGAELVRREEIPDGLRVVVGGPDERVRRAVRRTLEAHAPMLERETGWDARVEADGERTALTVTADRPTDAAKIRGLGYIGLMATGAHHTRHHWMIATGDRPHAGS